MYEEFLQIADYLDSFEERVANPKIQIPLERLENATRAIGKAWSGSWIGYQSRVYYENFEPPPPGAHFSQEWGFIETSYLRSTSGRWKEFTEEQVRNAIYKLAANPDLTNAQQLAEEAKKTFGDKKQEVLSLLSINKENGSDGFLNTLEEELKKMKIILESDIISGLMPSGSLMSRDSLAVTQGLHTPPHIIVLAEIVAIKQPVDVCLKLSALSRKAGSHLIRLSKRKQRSDTIRYDRNKCFHRSW